LVRPIFAAGAYGRGFPQETVFSADIEAVLCGFYGLRAFNLKRA
jgi:hypothetical protein